MGGFQVGFVKGLAQHNHIWPGVCALTDAASR